MNEIFEQIPSVESKSEINSKIENEIEKFVIKISKLIQDSRTTNIELHYQIDNSDIKILKDEIHGKMIIDEFRKKGWNIYVKNNFDKGQSRKWESISIEPINNVN